MDDGASECDPLLFAATQLVGSMVCSLLQADAADRLTCHFASLSPVDALEGECDGDVLLGGEAGDEVEGLEDESDGASAIDGPLFSGEGAEVALVDGDGSGGGGI